MEFKPTPYTKQQFLSKLVIPKDPTYGNPNQIETKETLFQKYQRLQSLAAGLAKPAGA